MDYAKVFNWDGKIIAQGFIVGCKTYVEKYPRQYVELYKTVNDSDNEDWLFDHIEGEQYFIMETPEGNLLYDSRTHEEHSWLEYEKCSYNYKGCTNKATRVFSNEVSGHNFPCCDNCYDIRYKKQQDINRKYMDIKPFDGPNEAGEYYDENSY